MRYAAPLFVLGILLVACGGGGPGATPRETFENAKSALGSQDWGAIYDLTAPARKEKAEQSLKAGEALEFLAKRLEKDLDDVKGMDAREVFIAMMEKLADKDGEELEKRAEAEFVKEEIDGDKAEVFFKVGDEEDSMDLIKVDGKWYVDESVGM